MVESCILVNRSPYLCCNRDGHSIRLGAYQVMIDENDGGFIDIHDKDNDRK